MKLGNLKEIESIMMKIVNADLPVKVAFELNSIIDEIDEKLDKLEKFRVKLVKKYGEADENGNIRVPKDKAEIFNNEYMELMDSDVDIKPVKIPFETLENMGFKVKIKEINALYKAGFLDEPK